MRALTLWVREEEEEEEEKKCSTGYPQKSTNPQKPSSNILSEALTKETKNSEQKALSLSKQ
ncbi:hypothetical protein JHK85_045201 [Glycine max]|nr:hypothetical protein JHK85_045201 [Glycine max]KHN27561.1 hypothetical protein glysoja_018673 [Glycine soja]